MGGVEYVTNAQDNYSIVIKIIQSLEIYDPPEKNDSAKLRQMTKWYVLSHLLSFKCSLTIIVVRQICGV